MTAARWTNTAMRVLISAEGGHDPVDHHYMVVDGHGFLVDLSKIAGRLLDPTILRVSWGPQLDNGEMRNGGCIVRQDGTKQLFWDPELLKPYLDAWRLKREQLLRSA